MLPLILGTLSVNALLGILVASHAPAWEARGITATGGWVKTYGVALAGTILTAAVAAVAHTSTLTAVTAAAAVAVALIAASTDLASTLIPKELTRVVMPLVIPVFLLGGEEGTRALILTVTVGAVLLGLSLVVFAAARKRAIGMGDIRLLVALTALTGWFLNGGVLLGCLWVASLVQLVMLKARRGKKTRAAFAPAIAVGFIPAILWGILPIPLS